jgi:conjugative relaxase-like TrwC/TraI family protein
MHMRTDAQNSKDGKEDYYSREGAGHWSGDGAKALNLSGEVTPEAFAAVVTGFSPTGESLAQNAGDPDRRAGWDCTFSAPKSVSAAWAVADEKLRAQIEAAHQKAVDSALKVLQDHAAYGRVGGQGMNQVKASLVVAQFQHGTSREQEPQLHTHSFVMNAVQRPDGSWGTIEAQHLYEWQKAAGLTYQAALQEGMEKIGLQTERDGQDFFKLKDVPEDLCEAWSTRRHQIEESMAKHGAEGSDAARTASLDTRKAKGDVDLVSLREGWKTTGADHGLTAYSLNRSIEAELAKREAEPKLPTPQPEILASAWNYATEHDSVLKERDLYIAAAHALQDAGGGSPERIEQIVWAMKETGIELYRREEKVWDSGKVQTIEHVRYTTAEIQQKEAWVLANAHARAGETRPHLDPNSVNTIMADYEARKGFQLSPDQRDTIKYITTTSGGVAVVVGDAGTGKSTAAEVVKDAFQSAGYEVIGCAPSNKAAVGLKESADLKEASSVQKLVAQLDGGQKRLSEKSVVIVDEAAMMGSQTWAKLQAHCDKAGAKLVAVGDHKQLQAVEAGGPFRNLQDRQKGIGAAQLTTVMRQRDEAHKEAVKAISRGEAAKALAYYIDKGAVHQAGTHKQALKQCTDLYTKARAEVGADKVLVTAATNKQVQDLNREIRAELVKSGQLEQGKTYTSADKDGGKPREIALAPGDRVALYNNVKDGKNSAQNSEIGTIVKPPVDQYGVEKLTKPTEVWVKFDGDKEPQEPRKIDLDKADLRHGYAMTTHKLQGATAERAIVYNPSGKEMGYVQASRAKERTDFVVTKATVDKMARQAEAQGAKPTEKMTQWAKDIEARRLAAGERPALPKDHESNFSATRDYLNKHADYQMNKGPERDKAVADHRLEDLKHVVSALEKSQQKETTLDYQIRERTPEALDRAVERERGTEHASAASASADIKHEAEHGREAGNELEMER